MLNTYEEFVDRVEQMIKYRSKNYVNTDCDIHGIIDTVYNDIASDVVLAWNVYEFIIVDPSVKDYVLPKDNRTNDDVTTITERYYDIFDIADEDRNRLLPYFISIDRYTIRVEDDVFRSRMKDQKVLVLRNMVQDIKVLDPEMYMRLLSPMLEGIMYYIEDSIPSQVDGQLANLHFQRFYNAKRAIKDQLPQTKWLAEHDVGREYSFDLRHSI